MKVLFNASQIDQRVRELGREISSSYQGDELFIIGILKGGFMFMSDLVRHIDVPTTIGFVRLSSYGDSDTPQAEVKILDDLDEAIRDKHVLIVDDIMDTGQSIILFKKHLQGKSAASVRVCTMIDKTERRSAPITPDYYGFHIDRGFIVGYGLDYAEKHRTLPDIYMLEQTNGG